ncbi:MAG: LacI family DNA-binding transcriptional regulator [Acidimicrobiales bacterium]
MRVRLHDVAERAGVSKATASMVLNGKALTIPEPTRIRVRTAANELGYRPNLVAQNLRSQSSRTIAVLSDQVVTTPYAGAMIEAAQEVADEQQFGLLLINVGTSEATTERAVHTVLDRQVDGVVYASMYHRTVDLPSELSGLPTVVLNARPNVEAGPWVVPDEHGGATAAMQHLLDAGHTRIGWIEDLDNTIAAQERSSVWRTTLVEHGVEAGHDLTASGESTTAGGISAAEQLLSGANRPTALFCYNDRMAAGAAIAARRLGLSVPRDLSIVGFDNQVLVAEAVDPGLTTVQLPHYEMGRWAMEQVFGLLDEGTGSLGKRMPCPLVERQSVAPPNIRETMT